MGTAQSHRTRRDGTAVNAAVTATVNSAFTSVPPTVLVLLGVLSVQVGAGFAKQLFDELSPAALVLLRLATSTIVLLVFSRRALRGLARAHSRHDLRVAAGFGLTLALMNFSIYQAFSRIPLGVAVTIEFLGPLGVAIAASRRRLDLLWAALALTGVALLTRGGPDGGLDAVGVGFALLAAVGWAGYIFAGAATGARFPGFTGLALASLFATLVMLPGGLVTGGADLLEPHLLLIGAAVGLLSSVIPYSLELEALRRIPARTFGILMSLEPAVAAVAGMFMLGEILAIREWAAIGCVVIACAGATRAAGPSATPPEPLAPAPPAVRTAPAAPTTAAAPAAGADPEHGRSPLR